MAWSIPITQITGALITATIWNTQLVDNMSALKDPPSANFDLDEGSDYTTTSTSFTDADATEGKFKHTIETNGGDVMVSFHGTLGHSGNDVIYFDLDVDGVRVGLDDGIILNNATSAIGGQQSISFTRLITGLSAGSHIFKLQWKVRSGTGTLFAGAGTSARDVHSQFFVREVS